MAVSCQGKICFMASVCFWTAEHCWAKSLTVSPKRPAWEMGVTRKQTFSVSFISARSNQRCRSWTSRVDIIWPRAKCSVSRRVHFLQQPRLRTTLVQLFESFCLMDLQDDPGMHGVGGLSSSGVSLSSQSCHRLTHLGQEARTIPPGGGTLRAQVHRNCQSTCGTSM